jgi:hypothetical protein
MEVILIYMYVTRDKLDSVTKPWCVLRLRMEERPPIWRVAANIFNKQSRASDKGWSSNLGFGRVTNNSSPSKVFCCEMFTQKTSDAES